MDIDRMEEIEHIDCSCRSFDHIMRIWYDKEYETYSIEYKLEKFPFSKANRYFSFYPNKPFDNFITNIKRHWYMLTDYLTCICCAVVGKPYWFAASTELDTDGVKKLIKFLNKTLDKNN